MEEVMHDFEYEISLHVHAYCHVFSVSGFIGYLRSFAFIIDVGLFNVVLVSGCFHHHKPTDYVTRKSGFKSFDVV